jgi:hypothetical protein
VVRSSSLSDLPILRLLCSKDNKEGLLQENMDDSILRSRKSILIIININANLQIVIGLYDCAS